MFQGNEGKGHGKNSRIDHLLQLLSQPSQAPGIKAPNLSLDSHPLDPLTPEEVKLASEACKGYAKQRGVPALRFNCIYLEVRAFVMSIRNSPRVTEYYYILC